MRFSTPSKCECFGAFSAEKHYSSLGIREESINFYIHYAFYYVFFLGFDSGRSGMKSFTSKRFLARGGKIKEGVSVLDIPSTYFWRAVEKTKFTVGIVVADGDKDETLSTQSIPSGKYITILSTYN